jgi:hypothetical protein
MNLTPLIPAKAGIQLIEKNDLLGKNWIPASAGMSGSILAISAPQSGSDGPG